MRLDRGRSYLASFVYGFYSLLVCMSSLVSELRAGSVVFFGRLFLLGRGFVVFAFLVFEFLRRYRIFRKFWRKLLERKL